MKKVLNFLSEDRNISIFVFGVLITLGIAFLSAPSIYAHFIRSTGDAGWDYGYGYGYGYGFGYDYGEFGYRYARTAPPWVYYYGYGWGYKASTTTSFGGEDYETMTPEELAEGAGGIFRPDDIEDPTSFEALVNVNMSVGDVSVLIPEGTVLTDENGDAFDVSGLDAGDESAMFAAFESALESPGTDVEMDGAVSFGIPELTLYFSRPVTVYVPVAAENGETLSISRTADGVNWTSDGFTASQDDTCTNGIGSDPVDTAVVSGGMVTIHTCRASDFAAYTSGTSTYTVTGVVSGGGGSVTPGSQSVDYGNDTTLTITPETGYSISSVTGCNGSLAGTTYTTGSIMADCTVTATFAYNTVISGGSSGSGGIIISSCSNVTYGDWSDCVDGVQTREVISRLPLSCSLTASQEAEQTRDCGSEEDSEETPDEANAPAPTSNLDVDAIMKAERDLVTNINDSLVNRLLGRILLQVENNGQAWYLEPLSKERYFMGRPLDAFNLMRKFGLGISNADFDNFSENGVPSKFSGRILLKVESSGEAYYVNPVDMKMYYLGRPADAFNLMRELALGISNENIYQIPVANVE
jgi:hypothetical protein